MNHFVVNLNKVEGFKSLKRLERLERLEPARWVARLLNCANPQLSLIKRFLDGVAGAVLGVQRHGSDRAYCHETEGRKQT